MQVEAKKYLYDIQSANTAYSTVPQPYSEIPRDFDRVRLIAAKPVNPLKFRQLTFGVNSFTDLLS
jgi:hypothetical protein